MGDQQQWHQERGNEIRGTLQPRIESNSGAIALVEGIEQIRGTKEVECPNQDDAQSSGTQPDARIPGVKPGTLRPVSGMPGRRTESCETGGSAAEHPHAFDFRSAGQM